MPEASVSIQKIDFSSPFQDQKPGTSGLRKRVHVFQQPHYTEAFLQSIFNVLPQMDSASDLSPKVLVVGGDGRFFLKEAVQKIIGIAMASEKVDTLLIGQNGILSTPAASYLIRKHKALGGILLTASHNPGGPENDFGIKFNSSNGGPATELVTDQIFQVSKTLTSYKMAKIEQIPLDKIQTFEITSKFKVQIIDSVADYVHLMKQVFDFESIKKMVQKRYNFKILFDAMHGVTGPYARQIFVKELGLPTTSVMRDDPLPDFGGGHPDPNLTYAHDLVTKINQQNIDFGAASDGDGDRNMILGANGTFVNPCDSIAVIAVWAQKCIPYFKQGLKGVARSMPTSRALDRVANKFSWPCYEVPTGWKFFGNLMDANKLSLCGEESFGTGSDHIREKDGLWAVLAWLSLLSHASVSNPTISVHDILMQHYKTFGRNYFTRYDFEDLDAKKATAYLNHIQSLCLSHPKSLGEGWDVKDAGDFEYKDPVDHSLSQHQGLYLHFINNARVIFRLSGTGSQNATLRLYFEKFEENEVHLDPSVALKDFVDTIFKFTQFVQFVGTDKPTVIT